MLHAAPTRLSLKNDAVNTSLADYANRRRKLTQALIHNLDLPEASMGLYNALYDVLWQCEAAGMENRQFTFEGPSQVFSNLVCEPYGYLKLRSGKVSERESCQELIKNLSGLGIRHEVMAVPHLATYVIKFPKVQS